MAVEAQRLISISLGKIAHSRSQRGGSNLHKSLMVATVLQKARHIFMEETFHLMNTYRSQPVYGGVTAGSGSQELVSEPATADSESELDSYVAAQECGASDKENQHSDSAASEQPTYLDLDTCQRSHSNVLCDWGHRMNALHNSSSKCSAKRKRVVTEAETEDAISSILPKKSRTDVCESDCDSDSDSDSCAGDDFCGSDSASNCMEIEQITSLVSIFSFGGFSRDCGKLSRSLSAPDLCSTQAHNMKGGVQATRTAVALAV